MVSCLSRMVMANIRGKLHGHVFLVAFASARLEIESSYGLRDRPAPLPAFQYSLLNVTDAILA